MNDEFLKKHQVRPDAEFVETLYQQLEGVEERRFNMFGNRSLLKMRHKIASAFILVLLAVMVIGFSPSTQSAIQSWWGVSNGISVNNDESVLEPSSIAQLDKINIDHFDIEYPDSSTGGPITVNWKVTGEGTYSLFWQPGTEVIVIDSGGPGEYSTELELPENVDHDVQLTLSVSDGDSSRSQSTIKLSPACVSTISFGSEGCTGPTLNKPIAWLQIDQATISYNPQTDELIVFGLSDKIRVEDNKTIHISNSPSRQGLQVVDESLFDTAPVSIDIAEATALFPTFNIPHQLPPGYNLSPEAVTYESAFGRSLSLFWKNAAGDVISMQWGKSSGPFWQHDEETDTVTLSTVKNIAPKFSIIEDDNLAHLTGRKDGFTYYISATDQALNEATLARIINN